MNIRNDGKGQTVKIRTGLKDYQAEKQGSQRTENKRELINTINRKEQ